MAADDADPTDSFRFRTLQALPEFTGATTALMLHMLGYRTLWQIAASHHAAIRTLPHIGDARFAQIEACLRSRGLGFDDTRGAVLSIPKNMSDPAPRFELR